MAVILANNRVSMSPVLARVLMFLLPLKKLNIVRCKLNSTQHPVRDANGWIPLLTNINSWSWFSTVASGDLLVALSYGAMEQKVL